jgi:hypothetical protein
VTPADGNVINSEVTLVSTAQLEAVLLLARADNVDDSAGVLLLVERLQDQVVACRLFVLNEVHHGAMDFDL